MTSLGHQYLPPTNIGRVDDEIDSPVDVTIVEESRSLVIGSLEKLSKVLDLFLRLHQTLGPRYKVRCGLWLLRPKNQHIHFLRYSHVQVPIVANRISSCNVFSRFAQIGQSLIVWIEAMRPLEVDSKNGWATSDFSVMTVSDDLEPQ
ncbi:hypothetical protein TNCV_4014481 [Trichonephila clavipes]|nr:hypothetical protein TNCV_4014481 [Trichonephila clavipes]